MLSTSRSTFLLAAILLAAPALTAQSLTVYSGNGQMVLEQFLSTQPMTVIARDSAGRPAANVPITWSITSGMGSLRNPINTTDANGLASVTFLATDVPGGNSISQASITASSPSGSALFYITTTLVRPPSLPLVELLAPAAENRTIVGTAGSTVGNAIQVNVTIQAGPQTGQSVPNVGIRVFPYDDPATTPSGVCQGPGGIVLTDSNGRATCNLTLNQRVGSSQISVIAGEAQITPRIALTINPGNPCVYQVAPTAQTFSANSGTGAITLTTDGNCPWTASTQAFWIAVTGNSAGSGPSTIQYSVQANPSANERTGTITIGTATFNVRQAGQGGGSVLSFTNVANLPVATVSQNYSFNFGVAGGVPPYSWQAINLPPGLTLTPNNAVATLSGTPSLSGSTTFNVTVRDSLSAVISQSYTLTVQNVGGSLNPVFTNPPLRAGTVGQSYSDTFTSTPGCSTSIFGPRTRFAIISGSLPPGLTLDTGGAIRGTPTTAGVYTFSASVTDTCDRSTTSAFTITIRSASGGTSLIFSNPEVLTFNYTQGGAVPTAQTLTIDYSGPAVNFTAQRNVVGVVPWLQLVGDSGGTTPKTLLVGVENLSQLSPGTYLGSILISTAGATLTVPVTLNISAPQAISATPNSVTFNTPFVQSPTTLTQTVVLTSASPARITARTVLQLPGPSWLRVSPETVESTTRAEFTISANPAGLGQGSYLGFVVFDAGSGPLNVPVTLTIGQSAAFVVSPASMTFLQEAGAGTSVPQVLALNSGTVGLRFQATAVASGGSWLSVTPTDGQTPSNLTVSVNPQGLSPGTYSGAVSIRSVDGTAPTVQVRVTYTISVPVPTINAMKSAGATEATGRLTPGMLIELYGSGLGPAQGVISSVMSNNRLETITADTRVLFDEVPSPLLFVRNDQVNAIVPYEVSNRRTVRVVVSSAGNRSFPLTFEVAQAEPGIFSYPGISQGKILNQDNTINTATNGAEPDSIIQLYATGEGIHDAQTQYLDGTITGALLSRPRLPVTARIDGLQAEVLYAGSAPGLVAGVMQVNVRVPGGVRRASQVPVQISVGGITSAAGITVATR